MRIALIGVHYKDETLKSIIGARVIDIDTKEVKDVATASIVGVIKKGINIQGVELDDKGGIRGSNGKLDRYPSLVDNKPKNRNIVIVSRFEKLGFSISNYRGDITPISSESLIETLNNNPDALIANGKIVTYGDTTFISSITGDYYEDASSKALLEAVGLNKVSDKKDGNEINKSLNKPVFERAFHGKPQTYTNIDRAQAERLLKDIDLSTGLTVEQKILKCMLAIKNIRPFYFCVLNSIRKSPSITLPTMGVSIDTLYYNVNFVKECSIPEIVFVLLHEVCHISMRHLARIGHKQAQLWNVATDLYINKFILVDFGFERGQTYNATGKNGSSVEIKFLEGGLLNDKIDVALDTPEKIYLELEKDLNEKQGQQGQGQQGQGQQGQGQQGQGQQGHGQQGQGQQGQGQQGQGQQGPIDIEFRGERVCTYNNGKPDENGDLINDSKSSNMSEDQKKQLAKGILDKAAVSTRQMTGSFGGEAGSMLERLVEAALAPKVNWRSLIKNKLTLATQKVTTWSKPDKRFISRGILMPGLKAMDSNAINNIKICIDTSGSITDKDLGIALAQIKQLLKAYKAKAEVLYWDTQVRGTEPFENIQELMRTKPKGGGGTDVNCVFEEFSTKDYKIGKKAKPEIIVIFTDGYFGEVDPKHRKYRDTIWIIHENPSFKEPFGSKAKFRDED